MHDLLRKLPQVEKALRWPAVQDLLERHSRAEVTRALQLSIERTRQELLAPPPNPPAGVRAEELVAPEALVARLRATLEGRALSGYRRAINGTGIVLHTGLGRAVLAPAAAAAFERELRGYSVVEVDPATGERHQREEALRELFGELTGAPAATVVNNNAAATLLILAALAREREVIISRGQLVEIGGSFRIPEILRESGARLVEVGTTNRTYLSDYEKALSEETALILRVHTSNYEIRGFTCQPDLEDLVRLGRHRGVPVVSDLGSGCFADLSPYGFRREPLVAESVQAGADLVCFSGDKLLGGPQAGVILGRKELVARLRAHPLFRTLRVDKVTLVLLEATLRLYRDPDAVWRDLPVLRLLSLPEAEVRARVEDFAQRLGPRGPLRAEARATTAEAGSGSLPAQEIPSWGLALAHEGRPAEELAGALREGRPPVFSRIQEGRVVLDFRTVLPEDEEELLAVLRSLAATAGGS